MNYPKDEELYDAALEAMSLIVSHGDTHNYPNMIKNLLRKVLTLEPLFAGFMEERSYDVATPLANLFVIFGEVLIAFFYILSFFFFTNFF